MTLIADMDTHTLATHAETQTSQDTLLSIKNLCVDYITDDGRARAVDNVSLDIKAGQTLGLAGESGCGKSTLALAVTRLHSMPALITEGDIFFKGENILNMTSERLRRFRWQEVSMVFQSAMNSLNPVITVGEQLLDVIFAHKQVGYQAAKDSAIVTLEKVGIHSSRFDSYPHQLSGGMRQRVVIAIALILQPKLIIMDEPTTALDVVVEREIMDELNELKQHIGFAILFISHDLGLMAEISDHIGIMYAGQLVEYGPTQPLLTHPRHLYTKGLLSSVPSIYGPKKRLEGIAGNPLNLLDTPTGCYFSPRCNEATDICRQTSPVLVMDDSTSDHRHYRCHHPLSSKQDKQRADGEPSGVST